MEFIRLVSKSISASTVMIGIFYWSLKYLGNIFLLYNFEKLMNWINLMQEHSACQ